MRPVFGEYYNENFFHIAQDSFLIRVYIGRNGLSKLGKAPALTQSHHIPGAFLFD
jgi:hypothetical protein